MNDDDNFLGCLGTLLAIGLAVAIWGAIITGCNGERNDIKDRVEYLETQVAEQSRD